ncbi:replication initiator protein A, partial [Magnetococcales bacterium HHB-1]
MNKNTKNIVKQDMNFSEFPLWLTNKDDKRSTIVINTNNGVYTLNANQSLGIPDSFDVLLLYYFLFISQKNRSNFDNAIEVTANDICKNLRIPKNSAKYDRIRKSLNIWAGVSVTFDGCFYVGKNKYVSMGFHIFDYEIEEKISNNNNLSKRIIKIEFNRNFIKTIGQSRFFQNIDLDLMIGLKRPLARRLYEYLPKQFLKKNTFSIGVDKLFPKM